MFFIVTVLGSAPWLIQTHIYDWGTSIQIEDPITLYKTEFRELIATPRILLQLGFVQGEWDSPVMCFVQARVLSTLGHLSQK